MELPERKTRGAECWAPGPVPSGRWGPEPCSGLQMVIGLLVLLAGLAQ